MKRHWAIVSDYIDVVVYVSEKTLKCDDIAAVISNKFYVMVNQRDRQVSLWNMWSLTTQNIPLRVTAAFHKHGWNA